jgi:hypothetical protein
MKYLPFLLLPLWLSVADAQERGSRILSPFGRPLDQRLEGRTEWRMKNGDMLKAAEADGIARLFAPQGTVVELSAPEHLEQVVVSRSATCLLLRVMVARPDGGSDFSRLIRLSRDTRGRWIAETVFSHDTPPLNELHTWIPEIGAISDSGRMALIKLGGANQQAPPYYMYYRWETWTLDSRKKVADGIRVPDYFDN